MHHIKWKERKYNPQAIVTPSFKKEKEKMNEEEEIES